MSLRERNGKWHYRFHAAGRRWYGDTGLAATARNKNAAMLKEAEARRAVTDGKGDQLRLEVRTFSDGAEAFITWAMGEHRTKPNTWIRLRSSVTSLKEFLKQQPLHTVTIGQVMDYMGWRRGMGIKEISLRHDLHALSKMFKFGMAHNWCRENPVTAANLKRHGSKMPSDKDAVRIHVLTPAEEMLYFDGCLRQGYQKLHDLAKLMLLQGPRPEEVMKARVEHVDLERGTWFIPKAKTEAGKRTLRLTAESRSILAARKAAASPAGWLFEGKKKGTHVVSLENLHRTVLRSTGLAFVVYDMRHTFATRFYKATRDSEALRLVLGHSNLRMVEKYVHLDQEYVDGAMKIYEATRGQSGANASTEKGKLEPTSAKDGSVVSERIQ